MVDLHPPFPPLFLLFKDSPFTSTLHLSLVSFSLQLIHPCTGFAASFLFRFPRLSSSLSSFFLSHFLSPSYPASLFRLPVLHLRLSPRALIWPPGVQLLASFSLQFFRHSISADGHDGERVLINFRATPFYFLFFLPRCDPFILIHRPVSRPAV